MGQVLLSLGAIILLGSVTLGVNSMYIQSVEQSVDAQVQSDAINFGRDLSERINSYAMRYDQLDQDFGHLNDHTKPESRLQFTSQIGITYFATVELTGEVPVASGQNGRIATITVYEENRDGSGATQLLQMIASVTNVME
ncbi:MAG: hypothetical protein LAT84_09935 [Balneolia bacterium]|nr:hypothetical protein [Balneolia bacterium]